jgi:hypothetical protein
MKTKRFFSAIAVIIVSAVVLFSACSKSEEAAPKPLTLIGTWENTGSDYIMRLTLNSDNTYISKHFTSNGVETAVFRATYTYDETAHTLTFAKASSGSSTWEVTYKGVKILSTTKWQNDAWDGSYMIWTRK